MDNGLKWLKFAVYILGAKLLKVWVKTVGCTPKLLVAGRCMLVSGDRFTPFTTPSAHMLYTFFTQVWNRWVLRIKTLSNGIYLFTNHVIKLDSFLDFFNRVNSGSVILTTEFTGNLGET